MDPNKDETMDEFLNRVGAVQSNTPYKGPIPEEIKATHTKMDRRGLLQKSLDDLDLGAQKFNGLVEGARLPEIAGGVAQGAADVGRSLVNLIPGVDLPRTDLSKNFKQDPLSQTAFSLGTIPPKVAAWSRGAQLLKSVPSTLINGASLLPTAARGAITGTALGEDNRTLGALAGSVFAPLNELGSNRLAQSVMSRYKGLLNTYNKKYGDVFKSIQDKGIKKVENVDNTSFDIASMLGNGSTSKERAKYIKPLREYMNNPTFENAHTAQSQLGKLKSLMSSSNKVINHGISAEDEASIEAIGNARKKILGQAYATLNKKGAGNIANEYSEIQKGYKKEVVPYFNKHIEDYLNNKTTSKYFVKNLPNQKYFQKTLEEYHPDLERRGVVQRLASKAGNAAGLYGGYSLLNSLGLIPNNNFSLGGEE